MVKKTVNHKKSRGVPVYYKINGMEKLMASDAQRDVMRFKHEKKMKDADIAQRERESKRQMATDIITSVTGNLVPSVKLDATPRDSSNKTVYRWNAKDWYTRWIDLRLVANIPEFNDITTYMASIGRGSVTSPGGVMTGNGIPMVLFVGYNPALGHSYHDRGLILNATTAGYFTGSNQALSKMLSQIGKANSRSVSGSTEAIGYYTTLAIDLASLLARLNTNIAMVATFNPEMTRIREAYFKGIFHEVGSTITNYFINNVAQWKKVYAEFAARFNAEIVLPKDLTLLKRRVWLASTLLRDANLRKGQIYGFNQDCYRGIDIANNRLTPDIDACLGTTTSRYFNDNWLFADIAQFRLYVEHVFFELSKSSTYKELVSNMRSCIQPSDLATLPEVASSEPYVMGISDEILSQIHNLDIPFGFVTDTSLVPTSNRYQLAEVYTDGDQIYEKSLIAVYSNVTTTSDVYNAGRAFLANSALLNKSLSLYKANVDAEDIAVATRLDPVWHVEIKTIQGSNNVDVQVAIDACGTELPLYLFSVSADPAGVLTTYYSTTYHLFRNNTTDFLQMLHRVSDVSKFDWCPPIKVIEAFNTVGTVTYDCVNDVGNVFPVTNEDLQRVHEACVKSLYYTDPSIYKRSM